MISLELLNRKLSIQPLLDKIFGLSKRCHHFTKICSWYFGRERLDKLQARK